MCVSMDLNVVLLLTVSSVVSGQINGEFWWLNSNLTKLKHGTDQAPMFDDVNELDTDETAKVVFKDNVIDSKAEPRLKINPKSLNPSSVIHFRDDTSLANVFNQVVHINFNNKILNSSQGKKYNKTNSSVKSEDEFRFIFPGERNLLWFTSESQNSEEKLKENQPVKEINTIDKTITYNDVSAEDKNKLHAENICTFIKKSKCFDRAGTLYTAWSEKEIHNPIFNEDIVCCILPITTTPPSKIAFPDTDWHIQRYKRSNTESVDQALKQRNNLMSRKYSNNQRIRATTPPGRRKVTQKVVTSDEYNSDPYWNIKNANIRNPNTPIYQDPDAGYDDANQSYGDDYTVELPKPGLVGLYSDHRQSWTHNNNKGFSYDIDDTDSEEELDSSLGYSNIDPRLDQRSSAVSTPFRRRPLKLTAATVKEHIRVNNLQSPTISFHSNPDFQVLQGFKLLNLVRHKNRFVRKTPEKSEECRKNELKIKDESHKLVNYSEDYEDTLFEESLKQKLRDECGKSVVVSNCEKDEKQGDVEFGAHPWIALVVSTKSPQNVLCYATLIHTRAAVTAADCVSGKPPGAISIIAGVRNLDEDLELAQRRMVTVFLDTAYTSDDFGQSLALLHWKLPLTLDDRIQPACLADTPVDDNCVFVGWGGYDQEMRPKLRWQRASILAPQNCNKHLSKLQLNDALCAGVESRGTVTGIGGPLLCKNNDRWSTIGVAVWRDHVVILLPPQDWVLRSMTALRIQ